MLNDKHTVGSAKLSNIEDILNSIGFLGEQEKCEAGEDQEHKYTKKSGKKSKDYDGDGTTEDETDEYAGVKDKAIKKAMKKESVDIDSILDELTSEDIIFLTDELIEEVVEEFFNEMIEEGFDAESIETLIVESIDQELTILSEAKVTVGHDTEDPTPQEDKLSKIKSAVKKVASGAKKIAKKVAGAAGEVAGSAVAGYNKNATSSTPSSSSGSSSNQTPKKPGFLSRAGAALKLGLKKVIGKGARIASKVGDKVATRLGEEVLDEGDNYDKNRKRAAQRAAERNAARDRGQTGNVPGVGYVTSRRERETYVDAAGTTRHKSGAKNEEFVGEGKEELKQRNKNEMQRKAGNLGREVVSTPNTKKNSSKRGAALDRMSKLVTVIARDDEKKRFERMPTREEIEYEVVELMPEELVGTTYEATLETGETIIIEKVEMDGNDDNGFSSCWKGYKKVGTKKKGGKEVNNCVKSGYEMDGEEIFVEEDQFIKDVELVANWLEEEGIITNEDDFFELMEELTEEEIDELYDTVLEATAMAKRGYDETSIRNKIASKTGGGKTADRATALADRQTYGNKEKKAGRENLARKQRGDFRNTTSSSPGLHGYGHKSDDPKVKAKQSARGAQRSALTPNEKKSLGREGYEMIGNSLEEGGLEVRTYSWREAIESEKK